MGYSLKSSYRFPYNFRRDYLRPKHYIRWLRHVYQRVRYGVSDYDIWSLDYFLAGVLVRALPQFDNGASHVLHVLEEDRAKDGYLGGTWTEEESLEAQGRWDAMISELVSSLNTIYFEDEHSIDWYEKESHERMTKSLHQFVDHFRAFWL